MRHRSAAEFFLFLILQFSAVTMMTELDIHQTKSKSTSLERIMCLCLEKYRACITKAKGLIWLQISVQFLAKWALGTTTLTCDMTIEYLFIEL